MIDRVSKTEHFKHKITKRRYPRPELDLQDAEQGVQGAHEFVMSEYHPAGTCAMVSARADDATWKYC
jgi:hypothetical protein